LLIAALCVLPGCVPLYTHYWFMPPM